MQVKRMLGLFTGGVSRKDCKQLNAVTRLNHMGQSPQQNSSWDLPRRLHSNHDDLPFRTRRILALPFHFERPVEISHEITDPSSLSPSEPVCRAHS